jgi:hypothetical protein
LVQMMAIEKLALGGIAEGGSPVVAGIRVGRAGSARGHRPGGETYISLRILSEIKSARKPKLPGRLASPPSARVTKGTRVFVTEKPGDPRNRHAIFL